MGRCVDRYTSAKTTLPSVESVKLAVERVSKTYNIWGRNGVDCIREPQDGQCKTRVQSSPVPPNPVSQIDTREEVGRWRSQ